jgi:hypothetical protein
MIAAIRAFHDIVFGPAAPELPALVRALDALAAAYHATPEGAMSEQDRDLPEPDGKATRARIGPRFPALGYYSVADPLTTNGSGGLGDAIDDLADIATELGETLWRWDHLGADDAHWHFRGMYMHWGWHMRELQSFLFAHLFRR